MSKDHPPIKSPSSKPVLVFDPNNPASFKELIDTFNSYTGHGGKFLIVKNDESGIGLYEGTISADKHYSHVQLLASDTWLVNHNLEKYPSVMVMDSAGYVVGCKTRHVSINQTVLYFDEAFSGTAIFN